MSGLPSWVQELRLKAEKLPGLSYYAAKEMADEYYETAYNERTKQLRALSETVLKLIDLLVSRPAPVGMGESELERLANDLKALADNAYCVYARRALHVDETKGADAKMASGKFGKKELDAHKESAEQLGKHRAYSEALKLVRALLPAPPESKGEPR